MTSPSPSANEITATLLIEIPKRWPNTRVWRRNVGQGIGAGTVAQVVRLLRENRTAAAIKLLQSRHVKFGVPGEPDVEGIVGPAAGGSVTSLGGRWLGIEVKAGSDKMSDVQSNFRDMIRRCGGIYIEARSVEQALRDLAFEMGRRP